MSSPFNASRLSLAITIALLPGLAHTQSRSADTEQAKHLDTVVVTASGFEQFIAEAPASISVISREQLRSRPYENLADAVRDIEGVSVQGYDPGSTDITVRGMPGEYTLLLVDGRRQSTRETMNRGTGGVQANLLPPLDAIERIEVIRGAMSSLYGSDAIGGVINVITRKEIPAWSGSVTLAGTRNENKEHGYSRSASFWVGGPLNERVNWQLWGNTRGRDEDDIYFPKSYTSGADESRQKNVGSKLGVKLAEYQHLTLETGREQLQYTARPGTSLADGDPARFTRERHVRTHGSIGYSGQFESVNVDAGILREQALYHTWFNGAKNAAEPDLRNTVLDFLVTLPREQHTMKIGGQYIDTLVKGIGMQDFVTGYQNVDQASQKSYAVFVEDEFRTTDRFKLTGGIRADHAGRQGLHYSPRLYANYQMSDGWSVRGGFADGFKTPTLRQSTTDYCMTSGGGALVRGPLCGNPNLKPETSRTFEVGTRKIAENGSFSATVFNTDFRNKVISYISDRMDPRDPTRPLYVYDNITSVRIRGLELSGEWKPTERFELQGNYALTDSKRHGGGEPAFDGSSLDGKPLDMTPRHAAYAIARYSPTRNLSINASARYSGKQQYAGFRNGAVNVRTRPASTTFDLGGRWVINEAVSLDAGLLNATNKIVPVDTRGRFEGLDGNWYVDEGRRLWASLTLRF